MRRRTFVSTTSALSGATFSLRGQALPSLANTPAVPSVAAVPIGVNLAGMEYNGTSAAFSNARTANQLIYHGWTPPTPEDVAYVASLGMNRIRLPLSWELLQPVLDTTMYTTAGVPGALEAGHLKYITTILDACAQHDVKCLLDLHNYGRYVDYLYQANGSILTGVVSAGVVRYVQNPANRVVKVLGTDALTPAHLANVWSRLATQYAQHPGLGGYGLMNEPVIDGARKHPTNDDLVAGVKAAIAAIRAVDMSRPIYVPGDLYSTPVRWSGEGYGIINPSYPLADPANNLIYEAHLYLDHAGSGAFFDWEFETTREAPPRTVNRDTPAGKTDVLTGVRRLQFFIDWLDKYKAKGALTELGMPADSRYWQQSFLNTLKAARQAGIETYLWQGGRHWTLHNSPITVVPNVAQGRQQHAQVVGPALSAAGVESADLFDVGASYNTAGGFVITVYARGNLLHPVSISLSDGGAGGRFSATTITLPSGPNPSVQYTYTLPVNTAATITYRANRQVPPPRRVYSVLDPVAYAQRNQNDAARCILAKYRAVEYLPGNSYQDLIAVNRAAHGTPVGAVWDSGYGATDATNASRLPGNELGVVAWQAERLPTLIEGESLAIRFSNARGTGLRRPLRKPTPWGGAQSSPSAVAPFGPADSHFAMAAFKPTKAHAVGAVFALCDMQSNRNQVELRVSAGMVNACWVDAEGTTVVLPHGVSSFNKDVVATLVSAGASARNLRVNGSIIASNSVTLAPGQCNHIGLGVSYASYWTTRPLDGDMYGAIYGAGAPSDQELLILEKYLNAKLAVSVMSV